jgi:hypothetical protein
MNHNENKEVCAAEFMWSPNDKANTCASLKPTHKSRDEMKFTFDMAKCDKIFDELVKLGKIKMSHTIPPLDQLKRRVYCKFHNSFSHATNDCNNFHRQIQSAINEGRLKFHDMQVDENPFPSSVCVNTFELSNPKVLIGPDQTKKAKGKNVIIGEKRLNERLPLEVIPKVSATSTLGGQDKTKAAGNASAGLTGVSGRSDRCLQKGSRCSKPKKRVRLSFSELLAKYKREEANRNQSNQSNGAKGIKAPPRREDIHHQRGNLVYSQYLFVGSVIPSSWYYPCYYSPADYSSMYMNSYMIQYPIAYSNYGALQRLIVCKSNLWSKIMYVLLLSKVRIATSKTLSRCIQGGVPQACPTLRKGDCKDCASEEQWSS